MPLGMPLEMHSSLLQEQSLSWLLPLSYRYWALARLRHRRPEIHRHSHIRHLLRHLLRLLLAREVDKLGDYYSGDTVKSMLEAIANDKDNLMSGAYLEPYKRKVAKKRVRGNQAAEIVLVDKKNDKEADGEDPRVLYWNDSRSVASRFICKNNNTGMLEYSLRAHDGDLSVSSTSRYDDLYAREVDKLGDYYSGDVVKSMLEAIAKDNKNLKSGAYLKPYKRKKAKKQLHG